MCFYAIIIFIFSCEQASCERGDCLKFIDVSIRKGGKGCLAPLRDCSHVRTSWSVATGYTIVN